MLLLFNIIKVTKVIITVIKNLLITYDRLDLFFRSFLLLLYIAKPKSITINNITIYPTEYFNPLEDSTGKLKKTKNTHSIHWYAKSWVPKHLIIRSKILKPIRKILGIETYNKIKKIVKIK